MLPAFIEPQLPKLATEAPASDRWLHEVKLDGHRLLGRIDGGRARLITLHALGWRRSSSKGPEARRSHKQDVAVSLWAGLATRMVATGVCAAVLVATAAAREIRPVEVTITEAVKAGSLKWLHAALVVSRGETLAEVYFDGSDEQRGRQLGVVHHGPDTLHDIRSITKSVTALLYEIASAEGKVPGPDAPLLAQFPSMPISPVMPCEIGSPSETRWR